MLEGKDIFVTGASGFVGAHLVHRLLREGARVHVSLRSGSDTRRLKEALPALLAHEVDLMDEDAVVSVFDEVRPKGIFHLAGVSQSFGSIPTPADLIEVNVRASIGLMNAAERHPYDFFVNTSSFVEVGKKSEPIREYDAFEPTELYGISRIPALLYGQVLGRGKGSPVVTVRVFTPYGPFLQKGKLVYELITRALRNQEIVLTNPHVTRDFVYIDDLIDLYVKSAEGARRQCGEVFNGGSGIATDLQSLVGLILDLTASKSAVRWGEAPPVSYDSGRWEADMSKVRDRLGWQPSRSLRDGILDTIAWFRANPDYWNS